MLYFKSSIIITLISLLIAYFIGGFYAVYITALLAVLEISLSFDNAVINAKVLKTMEPIWQKRFITYGMPIAVFGMRFFFPILLVAIASGLSVLDTFNLAINNPKEYQYTLESVEKFIYAFGGAFLLMVFLDFIFDNEREDKWIKIIENSKIINQFSKINNIELIISTCIGLIILYCTHNYNIFLAYFSGVLLHLLILSLDNLLNTNGIRSGIIGLLYLEVLDASFSFDGVIGAFALSSDIIIIMLGLGSGAMFVRSLTIYFVEKSILTKFKYLEHGANYAIATLSFIMFYKIFGHLNEIIVGTIGIVFIGISAWNSTISLKK